MRTSRFNFWKLITFVLLFLVILTGYYYLKEYRKNLNYKKELKFIKENLEKTELESIEIQKQIISSKHPLNVEKEKKDKFGEALEGEKVILVSEEILKSTTLPMVK